MWNAVFICYGCVFCDVYLWLIQMQYVILQHAFMPGSVQLFELMYPWARYILKFLCYANVFNFMCNLLHVHELYFMYNDLLPMPPIKTSTVVKFNQLCLLND